MLSQNPIALCRPNSTLLHLDMRSKASLEIKLGLARVALLVPLRVALDMIQFAKWRGIRVRLMDHKTLTFHLSKTEPFPIHSEFLDKPWKRSMLMRSLKRRKKVSQAQIVTKRNISLAQTKESTTQWGKSWIISTSNWTNRRSCLAQDTTSKMSSLAHLSTLPSWDQPRRLLSQNQPTVSACPRCSLLHQPNIRWKTLSMRTSTLPTVMLATPGLARTRGITLTSSGDLATKSPPQVQVTMPLSLTSLAMSESLTHLVCGLLSSELDNITAVECRHSQGYSLSICNWSC